VGHVVRQARGLGRGGDLVAGGEQLVHRRRHRGRLAELPVGAPVRVEIRPVPVALDTGA
jgi:hypothetical protein